MGFESFTVRINSYTYSFIFKLKQNQYNSPQLHKNITSRSQLPTLVMHAYNCAFRNIPLPLFGTKFSPEKQRNINTYMPLLYFISKRGFSFFYSLYIETENHQNQSHRSIIFLKGNNVHIIKQWPAFRISFLQYFSFL